jgi:hypothetical protein
MIAAPRSGNRKSKTKHKPALYEAPDPRSRSKILIPTEERLVSEQRLNPIDNLTVVVF